MLSSAPTKPRRWLAAATWAYLGAIVLLALAMQGLADRWWPATALMFAPRWIWLLPLLVLVPWALWRGRRWLRWQLAAGAMCLLGVMGLNIPSPAAWLGRDDHADLRVVSYNIGEVTPTPGALATLLGQLAPDVAAFQECGGDTADAMLALKPLGWQVQVQAGSCVVTRHRIVSVQQRDPQAIWQLDGSGVNVRYVIEANGLRFTLVNLHLETVRKGLAPLISRHGDAADAMVDNLHQRELESMLARQFVREVAGPVLVTGDFNMPVESAIYRHDWGGLANAFSQSGWGLGHSKETNWHGIRIDHVLMGPGWAANRAWVGQDVGGDHQPMVADLRWVGGADAPPMPAPGASAATSAASAP